MAKNRIGKAISLLLLAMISGACSSGDERARERAEAIQRDSGAIRISESAAPSWGRGNRWAIDRTPETVLGSTPRFGGEVGASGNDSDPVPLTRVVAVRAISGGRIVVADGGAQQVLVFDSAGGLVTRFGRQGEGPGEFTSMLDAYVCGGDSIVVVDRYALHFFDDQGRFVRRAEYRFGRRPRWIHGLSTSCGRVLIQEQADPPSLGSWGPIESTFAWFDPAQASVDTVTSVGLLDVWTRRLYGAVRPFVLPWASWSNTVAVNGERLLIGHGQFPELREYDPSGTLVAIIRWAAEAQPITRSDRRRYSEVRTAWLSNMPDDPESRFLFPAIGEYPGLPKRKPLFDRILVDDSSAIWVRRFPSGSFGLFDLRLPDPTWTRQTWLVFDAEGVWLSELTLPEQFDLRAVARGRLFGVTKDSLDTEVVHVYKLNSMGK